MMKTYLMIDPNGLVQNICVWDGVTHYVPPPGWTLAELGENEYYEFGQPRGIAPPEPPQVLQADSVNIMDIAREMALLQKRLDKLQSLLPR